jgi:hypothetical protein
MYAGCLFCGGNASEPDHARHCDGRQGFIEAALETYPEGAGWKEPTTSKAAASTVDASRLRAVVRECLVVHGAMTADECASRLHLSVLTIRPRFSELRAKGEITDTGIRHFNLSGKRAIVWRRAS